MNLYTNKISEAYNKGRFDRAMTLALLLPELITKIIDKNSTAYDRNTQFHKKFMFHTNHLMPDDFFALQEVYVDKGLTDLSMSSKPGNLKIIVFIPGNAMHYSLNSGIVLILCIGQFIQEIIDGCELLWKKLDTTQKEEILVNLESTLQTIKNQKNTFTKFFETISLKIPLIPGFMTIDVSKILKNRKQSWF